MRWTATARALGARRSHLLAAAGVEWALIAAISAVVGIGAGVGAAAIAHRAAFGALAAPPPVGLTFPALLAALMLALAATLAAITVVIPAVAAVRVPPSAALKDTAGVDELELSRRVPIWPVAALFAVMFAALLAGMHRYDGVSYWAALLLVPACGVAAIALVVEGARRLIGAAGHHLSRSARPWALQAGLALQAHPRQTVAIANIQALTLAGIIGWHMADSVGQFFGWFAWGNPRHWTSLEPLIHVILHPGFVVTALLTAGALACVVMWSARRVTASESSTARALGLSASHSVAADATAWILAQIVGIGLGWLVGVAGVGTFALTVNSSTLSGVGPEAAWQGFAVVAQTSLVTAALAAVMAAATAAVAAVALRPRRALTNIG